MDLEIILIGVGLALLVVGFIWLLVVAFRRNVIWGIALVLSSISILVVARMFPSEITQFTLWPCWVALAAALLDLAFVITSWEVARRPFLWQIAGTVLVVLAFVVSHSKTKDLALEGPAAVAAATSSTSSPLDSLKAFFITKAEPTPDPIVAAAQTRKRSLLGPFRSKLPPPRVAPGEREPAPPGIFYMRERVATGFHTGVQAVLPGEAVTLLQRLPGGKLRVTLGLGNFDVLPHQVTDDLNEARELEKQDFVSRGGVL